MVVMELMVFMGSVIGGKHESVRRREGHSK